MTLSPREEEVVELVARDGMTDRQIARHLGITHHTVRTYIKRIKRRSLSKKPPRAVMVDLYYGVPNNSDAISSD